MISPETRVSQKSGESDVGTAYECPIPGASVSRSRTTPPGRQIWAQSEPAEVGEPSGHSDETPDPADRIKD